MCSAKAYMYAAPARVTLVRKNSGTTKSWRLGASIPLPLACEASALPFELSPLQDLILRYQSGQHLPI